jgi:hypothetical protein
LRQPAELAKWGYLSHPPAAADKRVHLAHPRAAADKRVHLALLNANPAAADKRVRETVKGQATGKGEINLEYINL